MLKTVEALIALTVLLSFSSFQLLHHPVQHSSIYQYELAEDAWRVIWLRGGLQPAMHDEWMGGVFGINERRIDEDADRITELTGLCVEMDALQATSCIPGEGAIVLHKNVMAPAPIPVVFRMGPE
ncbi:MAG: hypothetical protein PHY95_01730 [Candidatus ainarchaeum sp.]|nr:hypothetical protein [Candidatus ainarchaeum sp.]